MAWSEKAILAAATAIDPGAFKTKKWAGIKPAPHVVRAWQETAIDEARAALDAAAAVDGDAQWNALAEIRADGWMVAVHNDYRLNGYFHTFWLFTKDGRAVKGEGKTDAEALAIVASAIRSLKRG